MSLVNIVDKTLITYVSVYMDYEWTNAENWKMTDFWKKNTHRFKSELIKLSQYHHYGTIISKSLPGEENMGVNWEVCAFAITTSSPKDKEK